jgi:hypothetical protein
MRDATLATCGGHTGTIRRRRPVGILMPATGAADPVPCFARERVA